MSETVKLRAGSLGASGTLPAGSMARAIEDAMNALVPVGVAEDPLGRRKLALAIAQGVIGHLKAREQAFVVDVSDTSVTRERSARIDVM